MATKALTGGGKLAAKMRQLSKNADKSATLRVGFLENATYPDGKPVAMVAAIQEFGAPRAGIPPRPFFRPMIEEKSDKWGDAVGALLVQNNYDATKTLEIAGAAIKGQLQQSIKNVTSPALSPVTLLLRQRFGNNPQDIRGRDVMKARGDVASGAVPSVTGTQSKPLVWTGNLLQSVGYDVKEGAP